MTAPTQDAAYGRGALRALVTRRALALALPASVFAAFFLVHAVRPLNDYVGAALWAAVLFASAIGWGAAVLALARSPQRDWGMCAAVGFAMHLAIGGVLELGAVVSPRTSAATALAGVLAWAVVRWRDASEPRDALPPAKRSIAAPAVYAAAVILSFVALADHSGNAGDDQLVYFQFPRQLLAQGTLFEPFSLRRAASYGGQTYLHALVISFTRLERLHVVDGGFSILALVGLLGGFVRERKLSAASLVLPALFVLVQDPIPPNSASLLSGGVFSFAAFRLLARPGREDAAPAQTLRESLPLALALAAFCTLRQNYILPALLLPSAWYGHLLFRDRVGRARWLREAVVVGLATVALLAAWAVSTYASAHTVLYPILPGDTRPDYELFSTTTLGETVVFFFQAATVWSIFPAVWLMAAASVMARGPDGRALKVLLACSALGFAALIFALRAADDVTACGRYVLSIVLPFSMAASAVALSASGPRKTLLRVLALLAVGGHLFAKLILAPSLLHLQWGASSIAAELSDAAREAEGGWEGLADASYRAMQESVPPGEKLLVLVDQPFRFDFARNPIANFDKPGAMSPAPHVPFGKGADALARYFVAAGYRYVAFSISERSFLFRRSLWEEKAASPVPPRDGHTLGANLKAQAPFFLEVFDSFEELAKTRVLLFDDGPTRVLDLARRRDN